MGKKTKHAKKKQKKKSSKNLASIRANRLRKDEELIERVKLSMKNRRRNFPKHSILFVRVFQIFYLIFVGSVFYLLFIEQDLPWEKNTGTITIAISILFAITFFTLKITLEGKTPPKDKEEADIWKWKNQVRIYYTTIAIALFSLIGVLTYFILVSPNSMERGMVKFTFISLPIIVVGQFSILIYILNNPAYILKKITFWATVLMAVMYQLISMTAGILYAKIGAPNLLLFVGGSALMFIVILVSLFKKDALNLVQIRLIRVVFPPRLYRAVSSAERRVEDQYSALRIIKKLYGSEKYGVYQALSDEIIRNNSDSYSRFWKVSLTLMVSFGLFFAGAVGEGLIQDLINDDLKQWLCEKIGKYC